MLKRLTQYTKVQWLRLKHKTKPDPLLKQKQDDIVALGVSNEVTAEPLPISKFAPCDYDGCNEASIVSIVEFRLCENHARRFISCLTNKSLDK